MINISDFELVSNTIENESESYIHYDVRIPINFQLIESICGGQYSKKYQKITSCVHAISLTKEEIETNKISLKKLIDFKILVVKK
jgi:hypothetical protein